MHEWKQLCAAWRAEKARGRPCVLATLVHAEGSTYRRAGARALVTADGRCVGLLSGGCLEGDITARSRTVFESGRPRLAVYDMRSSDDLVFGLGLGCEGRLEIWLERLDPPRDAVGEGMSVPFELAPGSRSETRYLDEAGTPRVFVAEVPRRLAVLVAGAGSDAPPLVGLLAGLGFAVTVADAREGVLAQWGTREPPLPEGPEETICVAPGRDDPSQARWLDSLPDALDAAVLMTHHFETDAWFLSELATRLAGTRAMGPAPRLRYVGLLGPKRRRDRLLETIPEARALFPGVVHAPAGVDVGGEGPESVALSIAAELHAVLHGKDPVPLSRKAGPIHD